MSLHAPVDEVRSSIMPVNRRWPVQELLDACRRYFEKTGRRISFEYAMIRDVNDTPEMAKQLIRRLRGIVAHVNLIPLNDVAESPLKPSLPETVLRFQKTLEASGIPATSAADARQRHQRLLRPAPQKLRGGKTKRRERNGWKHGD